MDLICDVPVKMFPLGYIDSGLECLAKTLLYGSNTSLKILLKKQNIKRQIPPPTSLDDDRWRHSRGFTCGLIDLEFVMAPV